MRFRIFLFSILLLLIGCGQQAEPTATSVPTTAATATPRLLPTFTPTATPTEPPTPTATATPIVILPSLIVADQTLDDSGILLVDSVVAPDGGWVIVSDAMGVLGMAEVAPGEAVDFAIEIDPLDVGESVQVGLFGDEEGEEILVESAEINLTKTVTVPNFRVSNQQLDGDRIFVTDVTATQDSWIVISNDEDGEAGAVVGLQWVQAGRSAAVPIEITWRQSSPFLHAQMMWDSGEIGRFDPATDNPITVNNALVKASFTIDIPPSVTVIDQPVLSDTITIDRVISPYDGWVTVSRADENGEVENVVGFAPIKGGININVEVEIASASDTDTMFVQIHPDDGEIGEFEYPAGDRPEIFGVDFLMFPFSTVAGNYLISADQPLNVANGRATVSVPLVVVDLPVWVVIRAELAPGALGDPVGYTYVEAGISRDIIIEIDAEAITPTLYAVLHIDRDEPQVFEFPDGRDFELQRRRAPLAVPFSVLE